MASPDTDKKDSGFLNFLKRNITSEITETARLFGRAADNVTNVVESFGDYVRGDKYIWTQGPTYDSTMLPHRANTVNDILQEITGLDPELYTQGTNRLDKEGFSEKVPIVLDYQNAINAYTSRGLSPPDELTRLVRVDWGDRKSLILDPTKKDEVIKQADDYRNQGYTRIVDPVPHLIDGKDTGMYKEVWGKPDVTHYPDLNEEDITYRMLKGGTVRSVKKGQVPKNVGEMIGNMSVDLPMGMASLGISVGSDPAMQETGGMFQVNNSFDAALNAAELAFPAATVIIGPIDKNLRAGAHLWRATRLNNTGKFASDFKAISNVKNFDPSVDVTEMGQNSIRQMQRGIDLGQTDEEAFGLINAVNQMDLYSGNEAGTLASRMEFNKVSNTVANSIFETSFESRNKFAPEGYLFQIDSTDYGDVIPVRHNFDAWLDYVDTDSPSINGFSPKNKTFKADVLKEYLVAGSTQRKDPGPGQFAGLKLSTEEIVGLGIDRFLESKGNQRISISELRDYMSVNRLKVSEIRIDDAYSRDMFNSVINTASDIHGVALFKIDIQNMHPDSHIRKIMTGNDTTYAGHYGQGYRAEFFDDIDLIEARTTELLDYGFSSSPIPESARNNIFMTGRYSIRTDSNGVRTFHIDEIQSDIFQGVFSNKKNLNSHVGNLLDSDSNPTSPLMWGDKDDRSRTSWNITRGNSKPVKEVIQTPDGIINTTGVDIAVIPASKHTATPDSINRKFDSIVSKFDDEEIIEDFRTGTEKPNVLRSVLIAPLPEQANDYALSGGLGNYYLIEILDHIPPSRRTTEGVTYTRGKKSPVIRISHLTDDMEIPSESDPRLLDGITDGFARKKTNVTGFRYSVEDIVNNKAEPFKVIKSRQQYRLTDGVHNWGNFNTREEAAEALVSYMAKQNDSDFPLPLNFLFNEGNFHIPVVRAMVRNAVMEGVDKLTIDLSLIHI